MYEVYYHIFSRTVTSADILNDEEFNQVS